jgi:biopolymer transport protein ExbD
MAGLSRSKALKELNEEKDWELPTSMIDVVFLLLIFFLCASKFRQLERRLDAFLPKDKGPQAIQTTVRQLDEIVLHVTALESRDLQVPQFRIRNWSTHDPNELAGHLKRLQQVGDMPVVIDGRPLCPFRHVMTALDCCARAELTKVEFRPPPAKDGGGDKSHYAPL